MACAERQESLTSVISRAADAMDEWARWREARLAEKHAIADRTGQTVQGIFAKQRDGEPETADSIISRAAAGDFALWNALAQATLAVYHERYGPVRALKWSEKA